MLTSRLPFQSGSVEAILQKREEKREIVSVEGEDSSGRRGRDVHMPPSHQSVVGHSFRRKVGMERVGSDDDGMFNGRKKV